MERDLQYNLSVRVIGGDIQIRLNDLPAILLEADEYIDEALVSEWIIDGQNALSCQTLPAESDHTNRMVAQITIQIRKGQRTLFSRIWPSIEEEAPAMWSGVFESGSQFGSWEWQRAPVQEDPATYTSTIQNEIQRLWEALNSRNVADTVQHFSLKNREMSRAYHLPVQQTEAAQNQFFGILFAKENWQMKAIVPSNFVFTPYAGGRVIGVRNRDHSHVIQARLDEDDTLFDLPLLYASINRAWTIIR